MTDGREFEKRRKAEAAIARAEMLAPLAEAATPFFAQWEAALIEELIAAKTHEARAELAYALKAMRDLKGWLRSERALGEQAQRELDKGK